MAKQTDAAAAATAPADETGAVEKQQQQEESPVAPVQKSFWKAILPVIACGAGLFSDGYINNVRSPITIIIR